MIRVIGPTIVAWALMVMLPGPNFVMTSQQSTSQSRRAGLLCAVGVSSGAAVWATSALLGLGALLSASSNVLRVSRVIGGLVLLWFGVRLMWTSDPTDDTTERPAPEPGATMRHAYQQGVFTSLSNPKAAVFFGSLFVASLPSDATATDKVLLVTAVFAVSVAWYSCVALVMSTGPVRALYERSGTAIDRIAGVVLIALGLRLVVPEPD